ncbi:MAG: diguanylate cyclase [Candidatus Manganitrophaceae bacterium]
MEEKNRLRGEESLRLEIERLMARLAALERIEAEHQKEEQSWRILSSVVEQTDDLVVITDRFGIIEYVNPAFERRTGYQRQEAIGQTPQIVKSGKHGAEFYRQLWETISMGRVFRGVLTNRKKNGDFYYEEKTITPLRDCNGAITHFVSTGKDITDRMKAEEERARLVANLEYRATHDPLTDLPNRTLFFDRLRYTLLTAQRERGSFALLILDLDRFKEINDLLGHPIGDIVLREVGFRLQQALRESDTVARFGGDEFAIILPGANVEGGILIVRKIIEVLEPPFLPEGLSLFVRASIGMTLYPQHGSDIDTLMRRADQAMYRAKQSGCGYETF